MTSLNSNHLPPTLPPLDDFNAYADYYFYNLGVNCIPADTKNKRTYIKWSEWQIRPIPEELFNEWKTTNAFANGIAIIVGTVWRGIHAGQYLIFIDCDNRKAIDEFVRREGRETLSLEQLADQFLVEQHKDDLSKCHIYFYSEIQFVKKSSDMNVVGVTAVASEEIPAFEIKGNSAHGIAYCTPSIHKNGRNYEILGTTEPISLGSIPATEMMQHLDNICKKYGLKYLENDDGNGKSLIPTSELFKDNFAIYEKQNRHEALLRVMESLIKRTYDIYSLEEIKEQSSKWNQKHCIPPLDDKEFEKQWKDAAKYIIPKIEEEEKTGETTTTEGQHQQLETIEAVEDEVIELTDDLTKEVTFEQISNILSISIKKDTESILITFNGMLLAQTNEDQLNIGFQAESSTGKSYVPIEVSSYFPESEVELIASASPTAFYHDRGLWDDKKKVIIKDLQHKILIFLDQAHFQLLEKLRPMLSHDRQELHYMITDKNQKGGNRTKNVIIRGYPSVFFCTAKVDPDEQEKTRLILLSPSVEQDKLKESIQLTTLRKSDATEYRKEIVQDANRQWLVNRIKAIRQLGVREVNIPDKGKAVFDRFINEHPYLMPRHQRDYARIFSIIKAHALLNCFNREKKSPADSIMATQADIDAGFDLYKKIELSNELGLSPYIYKIYKEVIEPKINEKHLQGVSRKEMRSKYYSIFHKSLSPKNEDSIIIQIESAGLIQQEPDPDDKRKVLIYPPERSCCYQNQQQQESTLLGD